VSEGLPPFPATALRRCELTVCRRGSGDGTPTRS
jgi:hypothetical protein